ncbi:uncharacterized protein LOC126578002 isoform X2 [Anopheles aquasalis]|uniref:uncharacterized protein LOC126578002 isoform X2 n=1 Tax=Anopheles aquasalis TaxID=42839 RepID=UPI00215AC5B9|nr:uncharacterized protein LOC126578002 isoform X2 [Anopheles aquasalis]
MPYLIVYRMRKKFVQTLAARQREQNAADHHHHATRIADPHVIRRHEMMDELEKQHQSPLHDLLHLQQQQQHQHQQLHHQQQHLHLQVQLQLQLQQQKKQQKEQQQQLHPEDDEIIEILDDDQEVELMMERHRKYHPRKYVNLQQPPSKIYYDKLDDGLGPIGGDKDDLQEDEDEEDDERNQLVIDCPSRGLTNDRSMDDSSGKKEDERSSTTAASDRLNRSDPASERSDPNISISSTRSTTPPPAARGTVAPASEPQTAPLAPPPPPVPSGDARASSLRYPLQHPAQDHRPLQDSYPGSILSEVRKPTPRRDDFPKRRMSVMVPYSERLTRERHQSRMHHYPYDRYVPSEYDLAVPVSSSVAQLRRKEDERCYRAVEPPEPSPETFYSIPGPPPARGDYGEPPAKRKSAFSPPRDYERRHRLSDGGTKMRTAATGGGGGVGVGSSAAISPEIVVTPRHSLYYQHHPAQLPLYQYPFAQLEDWYRSGIPPVPPGIHLLSPVEQQTYLAYYHSHLSKLAYLQQQQQQQQHQQQQHNPYHHTSDSSLLSTALTSVSPGTGNHHQHQQQHNILHQQHTIPATSYPPPQYGFAKTDPTHYSNAPLDYSMYPGIVLPPGTTLTVNPRDPSPIERSGKPKMLSPIKPVAVVSSSTAPSTLPNKEPTRLLPEIVRPTVINQPSRPPPSSLDLESYPLMNGIVTTAATTSTTTTTGTVPQHPPPPSSATRPIALRPSPVVPSTLPAPSLPVLLTQLQRPTIIQSSKTARSSGVGHEGRSPQKRSLSPDIPVPVAAVPTTNTTTTTTVLNPTPTGKVRKSSEPYRGRGSATTPTTTAPKTPGSRPRGRPPGRQNNATSSTNRTAAKSGSSAAVPSSTKQPVATASDKSSRMNSSSRTNPPNSNNGINSTSSSSSRSSSNHARSNMLTGTSHIPVGLPSTEARLHRMRHEIQCFLQHRRQDIIKTMRLYSLGQIEHEVLLHKMRSHSINYRDFVHVAFALMSKCGQKVFAQQPPSEHEYRWPTGPPQTIADYFAKNEQCGSAEYVREYFDLLVLIVDNLLHQFAEPLECFLLTHVLGLRVKHRV